jgi:hypothetical protein
MVEQMRHERAASPREQIARLRRLLQRGLKYWKGALLVLVRTSAATYGALTQVKREYRSECTIFAKARIRTDDRDDSSMSADAIARQAARLKDMLTTRSRLEGAIKKLHLYPETTTNKTMLDAVEQMKPHVGFRALEGGQYVISFDGDAPDQVKDVTQYLSESLIGEFAAGDVDDLQHEANFLADEEERSLSGLEEATKALTIFLADHPEFAVEAKQAATPFGPSPTSGIPLMPKVDKLDRLAPAVGDGELGALFRQRARLEGEVHGAAGAAHGIPAATISSKQIDDQIAQAQAEVETAAKRVAETQGDLASKSNLTEDHPDMRAARMAASAAARQLHEAKVQLAALQQMKANGAPPAGSAQPPVPQEIADKLHQVDAQIVARRAQLAKAAPGASAPARPGTVPQDPIVTAVVELETDWQRLLRGLSDAKSHHDDLKMRAERVKLSFEAARSQAHERMAIIDPPYRPTHPSKSARAKVAIGGFAVAWILAIAYMTARLTLDDTLVDADDVDALGLVPMLGAVPRLDADPPKGSQRKVSVDAAA